MSQRLPPPPPAPSRNPPPQDVPRAPARATLRRVVPYLWPADAPWARRRVVLALLLLLASKLVAVGVPWLYKAAVDALAPTAAGQALGPLGLGAIGLTIAYGMARVLTTAFAETRDFVFVRVAQRALRQLARETFVHMHRLSLRYHITRRTGGLSRIIERGVKGVEFLLRFLLFSIGPLILELVLVGVIFALLVGPAYLAVVAVMIAVYVTFTFRLTEWRVAIRRRMNELDTEANQKAIDSLLNYETVKYFGAERREAERYDAAMAGYERYAVQTGQTLSLLNLGQNLVLTAGLVTVMVMVARAVQAGEMTVGDFVMVNAYMAQIMQPLNFLGSVYREIRQALVDMGEMFGLLGQPAEIIDRPGAADLRITGGMVELDDVHFSYDPERPILRGISLTVPAGRTLALVGASGSGKSTIGRLLFRFYDVTGGALRIDGQDVRDITQDSLHAAIGVVPQDAVLFNDTVYYNIAYGRPDASRAEVEAAARAARIHDFILSLPEGYDTRVGERGLKLSGGEKQRVGIARTLLKNPPILLLDEATSALDTQTERDIQDSLREMGRGRTVITIAHRLSTIADADEIVVLDAGRVVERGRHDELLARDGRYAAMWARQSAEAGGGAWQWRALACKTDRPCRRPPVAQTDSFIDEVTEEVRRDRLYRLLRRYGWIGVLAVLAIVGSSAWFEWQKARNRAAAAAFGDSLLAAMALEDPAGRAAALGAVVAQGDAGALTRLLQAEAALANTTDDAARAAGLATLAAIAADTTVSPLWRDLAQLHRLAAGGGDGAGDLSTDARAAALAELARPGRPFRPLALEQIALDRLAAGDRAGALADFTALAIDSAAPSGLRGRAQQMMLMLDDGPAAAAPAQE